MHRIIIDDKELENVIILGIGNEQISSLNYEKKEVYGRNGNVIISENSYSGYKREVKLLFRVANKKDEVIQKIIGFNKKIEFSDNANFYFYYNFNDGVEFEKEGCEWLRTRINLQIHPFKYFKNSNITTLASNGSVNNIGNIYSEPKVTIYGNGKSTVAIGDQVIEINIDEKLVVECKHGEQNCYDKLGNLSNSRLIRGDFFEIQPGIQGVALGNGITKIDIEGRWRNQ